MKASAPAQLEDHLGYWLRLVSNDVSHSFATKLAGRGITVAEWVVLRCLYDHSSIRPHVLAEQMGMTRGAISKLVDRLVEKGWVDRVVEEDDRRYQQVSIDSKGRTLVAELAVLADENEAAYFGGLTQNDREHLARLLKTLARIHNIRSYPIK